MASLKEKIYMLGVNEDVPPPSTRDSRLQRAGAEVRRKENLMEYAMRGSGAEATAPQPISNNRAPLTHENALWSSTEQQDLLLGGTGDVYDVAAAVAYVGSGLAGAAKASYRALRYGETLGPVGDESEDDDEEEENEAKIHPIGAIGANISDYITNWKGKNKFEAQGAWYLREAHHDPLGSDPYMLTMFLVAFLARMVYKNWYEALILALIVDFIETVSWVLIRMASPILAKELDACESRWIALVYNVFSFSAGIVVGSYVLYSWPGLISIWEALSNKHHCHSSGVFLVWAPCTDAQTFIVVTLLFFLTYLASFRHLYVPCVAGLVITIAVAMLSGVEYDVFNNVLVSGLTCIYFLVWLAAPINGTYVWNVFISLSLYLTIYSLIAISAA